MQYSQEHLKTMVYAECGGQTECIMGNWKIENKALLLLIRVKHCFETGQVPLLGWGWCYLYFIYFLTIQQILSWLVVNGW